MYDEPNIFKNRIIPSNPHDVKIDFNRYIIEPILFDNISTGYGKQNNVYFTHYEAHNFNLNCDYFPDSENNFNFPFSGCNVIFDNPYSKYGKFIYANSIETVGDVIVSSYFSKTVTEIELVVDKVFSAITSDYGISSSATMFITRNFNLKNQYGMQTFGTITTRGQINLIPNSYRGIQVARLPLFITSGFNPNTQYGKLAGLDLTISPVPNLYPISHFGKTPNVELRRETNLYTSSYKGRAVDKIALQVSVPIKFSTESYRGHIVDCVLYTTFSLDSKSHYGKFSSSGLQAVYSIYPVSTYGYRVDTQFYLPEATDIGGANSSFGHTITGVLNNGSPAFKYLFGFVGKQSSATLTIPVSIPVGIVNGYLGYSVDRMNINFFDVRLQPRIRYGKESTRIVDFILDKSDWIYSQYGRFNKYVNFATDSTFNPLTVYGKSVAVDIKLRPPVSLVLQNRYGKRVDAVLTHLYSPTLYPRTVNYSYWVDVSIDYATRNFDLCKSCYTHDKIGDNFNLELAHYDDPRKHNAMTTTKSIQMHVSLLTAPRLGFVNSGYGEAVDVKSEPFLIFPEITGAYGKLFKLWGDLVNDTNVRLNYGNIIPDIHYSDVELGVSIPDNDYYHYTFTGKAVTIPLFETTKHYYPRAYYAWFDVKAELYAPKKYWLRSEYGKENKVKLSTTVLMSARSRYGKQVLSSIWLPPMYSYYGYSIMTRLVTGYEVEFLEEGCLDNEYQYSTDSGDTDIQSFQIAAIELLPFRHSIKGRCF